MKGEKLMTEEDNLLKKVGTENPFRVPEGYFESFTSDLMSRLPEKEKTDVFREPTTWEKVRPWLYMAAMFASIWLMVKVFVAPKAEKAEVVAENTSVEVVEDDAFDDYMMASIDEYTIFETLFADSE